MPNIHKKNRGDLILFSLLIFVIYQRTRSVLSLYRSLTPSLQSWPLYRTELLFIKLDYWHTRQSASKLSCDWLRNIEFNNHRVSSSRLCDVYNSSISIHGAIVENHVTSSTNVSLELPIKLPFSYIIFEHFYHFALDLQSLSFIFA